MKLTKEIAEIIRKKFIEQVELSQDEALKWNAYLTSVNRAIRRQAYNDATPEQRIVLRQQTNDQFCTACDKAIQSAAGNRAFFEGIIKIIIQAAATSLIAEIEEM